MLDLLRIAVFRDALVVGIAVGSVCSLLSVLVVLKRMAFVGEGIAHAGFGGLGTAVFLGLAGGGLAGSGWQADLVVLVFCLATATAIGAIARRKSVEPDSAIGIMLVAAMAWGVLMLDFRRVLQSSEWYARWIGSPRAAAPNMDALLFGSLMNVTAYDAVLAMVVSLVVIATLAALFKEIVFYAFDETVSEVYGVPAAAMHYLVLGLLSVTIVLTVRLAGIVLVSALLVIPGATANLLSRRLGRVLAISWAVGLLGMLGGLSLSLQAGQLSTGPCIVAVLCLEFAAAFIFKR